MTWGSRLSRATSCAVAALAVLATVLLSACSGPAPAPITPTTKGSTADPSLPLVTITSPSQPAQEATPESAKQFVRYFWDLYNYAYQTFDTTLLDAASEPSCRFCSALVHDIERVGSQKDRITGYQVSVLETTSPPVEITTGTLVISVLSQQPGTSIGPGGERKLSGFRSVRSTTALTWKAGRWRIEGVTNDPKTRKNWPTDHPS